MVSTFSLNDWVLLPGIQLRERVGALPSYIKTFLEIKDLFCQGWCIAVSNMVLPHKASPAASHCGVSSQKGLLR